jgi:hypothetical protein
MSILKEELKYFLLALKKFWMLWLIPALLSIYMYLIAEIPIEDIGLAQKIFSIFSVSYKILEIVLGVFWPLSFVIIVLYICKLHFKMKIRKKTFLFLVLAFLIFSIFADLLHTFLFHNWVFRYSKYIYKIRDIIGFIFTILLFPFCVFKIKDIIKIDIIFIKKYFMVFVLLLIFNILFTKIINKISTLPYIKFISMYTFSNLIENMQFFLFILTIIAFKKRKSIQENLLKPLEGIRNKLHK